MPLKSIDQSINQSTEKCTVNNFGVINIFTDMTKMGRKTTVWILQATNYGNGVKDDLIWQYKIFTGVKNLCWEGCIFFIYEI